MRREEGLRVHRRFAMAVALGAVLLAAGAARAEVEKGTSLVLAKDLVAQTLTLEDGVYAVSPTTAIVDANGRPLTLAQVPVARSVHGLFEISPQASVRYQARITGDGRRVLERLVVGVPPPE